MAFKNTSDDDEGINDINVTPFVDVVLVLLVIFMVTAPMMIKEGLKVELPKTSSSDKMKPTTLSIVVTKTGQILVNGTLSTVDQLKNEIPELLKKDTNLQAIIGADTDATHGSVVKVMNVLKVSGVNNLAFQVVREE